MAVLTIIRDGKSQEFNFTPPLLLDAALEQAGFSIPRPCGGRGVCGKCAVTLEGAVSDPNEAERKAGTRLSCQAQLLGDARVTLADSRKTEQIEVHGIDTPIDLRPMEGRLGAAVDIGTTTLALKLYDLPSGRLLGEAAMLNPQTSVAADVMGRISAAMAGQLEKMQQQIVDAIGTLLKDACSKSGQSEDAVDKLVLTGNTTMLYLLTGRDPVSLSRAPFAADTLFDVNASLLGIPAYLPPCMNAFVGADISCAVLASGMCGDKTSLLCDIGTNGEMVLGNRHRRIACSTAAGPAFEGAKISMGMRGSPGAIDHVWIEDGQLRCHTIGDLEARGICGSGLLDLVACLLDLEILDESGYLEEKRYCIPGTVITLTQKDIREVQLAKAAIRAGMELMCAQLGVRPEEIQSVLLAGAFGNYMDPRSACRIGMIPPALLERITPIGNAAGEGAKLCAVSAARYEYSKKLAAETEFLELASKPEFQDCFVDALEFSEEDEE